MFKTLYDVLSFASEKEQSAYEYYTELAGKMQNPQTRRLFENIAIQELNHKRQIDIIRRTTKSASRQIKLDSEMLPKSARPKRKAELPIQNAIMLAIGREESAYKLYINLSETVDDPEIRQILITLAEQEADHRKNLKKALSKI
ncbi:hypothetical protein GF359_04630 [candidate division WOR-3 bacterium]|uniref:Rubrerythrin diiron-binding domain-containing protein n=1 Tax=candidate division WOR-3 bacterium TaxID=2052148 RepID=A0A9D5KAC5_UNCW3|nr:hypothetical protein [candidate division WOR-3 bacterium]MBD3364480.1 hypothetical protein [candidate division WOR-3 bacterium]